MRAHRRTRRRHLARTLWPDKLMYGTIVLVITGLVAALYAWFALSVGVDYEGAIPEPIASWPALVTVGLSLLAAALGALGMLMRNTNYSIPGALAGIAAVGLLGVGSVASLAALVLFIVARLEGEDTHAPSVHLSRHLWPDKSLAASAVLFVQGLLTAAWGAMLAFNLVSSVASGEDGLGYGMVILGGFLILTAALLHHQKAPVLGVLAALLGGLGFAFVIVGPLLTLVVLVLLGLAQLEREFDPEAHPAGPPREPPSALDTDADAATR